VPDTSNEQRWPEWARGAPKGPAPKLSPARQAHPLKLHAAGEHTVVEPAELLEVSRPTAYRAQK